MLRGTTLCLSAAFLLLAAAPPAHASRRLRHSIIETGSGEDGHGISVWTPFGRINIGGRGGNDDDNNSTSSSSDIISTSSTSGDGDDESDDNGNSTNILSPFVNITTNADGSTTISTPFTSVTTGNNVTVVEGPFVNITSDGNGTRVTGPFTNITSDVNGTNITAPFTTVNADGTTSILNVTAEDCRTWARDDPCRAATKPFFDTLTSNTTDDDAKDEALDKFCATQCGRRYTSRLQAQITGFCNATTTEDGSVTSKGNADEDNDVDDNERRHLQDSSTSTTTSTHSAMEERILKVRAGAVLGCLATGDGKRCASLKGCDFWTSCCAASLANAESLAGSPFSDEVKDSIENVCPGAMAYLTGKAAAC